MPANSTREVVMAKKANVHTVRHGDGWANRSEGASRVSKKYDTQAAAAEAGRQTARERGVEHLIHGRSGQIRERNSYGNDPHPPQG